MSLTKNATTINNIQTLANRTTGQATAVKVLHDKAGKDIKDYINDVLTVEIDTLDAANVKLTGNQTVAGVKTFSSSPVVPTPTTDMQACTKKYAEDYANSKSPLNITDGSITDLKLSDASTDIKERFSSHLADNMISLKDYCILDGITDDTANLLLAVADAISSGRGLYLANNKTCKISGIVSLFGIKILDFKGKIIGNSVSDELVIGYDSASTETTNYYINDVTSATLRVQGVKNGDVTINKATYFLLWADGDVPTKTSISYSRFNLGKIDTLKFDSQGSEFGWINENIFNGGRITTFIMDGNYPHNNNTFNKPMFENCTISINNGSFNQMYDCRFEGTVTITFESGTTENIILRSWYSSIGAYLRQSITPTITDNGNHNMFGCTADILHSYNKVFEVTSESNNFNISDFTKNADDITNGATKTLWESDYIDIVNDIGFEFESDQSLFRVQIITYDSTKTQIMSDTTNFFSSTTIVWNGAGYYYSSISRANMTCAMRKGTAVKYVKIIVYAYTAGTFKQAIIKFLEQKGHETNIVTLPKYNKWHSNTIPATGVWEVGNIVWNNDPATGEYIGWVCTAAGTSGTWKTFGAIS